MPIPVRIAAASSGEALTKRNEENQKADCEYRQHAQAIRLAAEEEAAGCVVSELERLSLPADVKCADTT
jgi:hypothetical protein